MKCLKTATSTGMAKEPAAAGDENMGEPSNASGANNENVVSLMHMHWMMIRIVKGMLIISESRL